MTLSRSTPLRRGKGLQRTAWLRVKRRTSPYGGASVEFPKVGDFQRFIRERDENLCQLCGDRWCGPVDVAHLLFKVGMGGRKKVSVNQPWNAAVLGRDCHREQEHDKALTAWVVTLLMRRHHYSLPTQARERFDRYAGGPTA